MVQLSNQIFEESLGRLLYMVRQVHQRSEVQFKVDEMSDEGRSKVRYVGGWAIFKILANYRRYIKANMFSLNPSTSSTVCTKQELCNLVEENVLIPFAKLEQSSLYPETLLHITDDAYQFFMVLEQKRIEQLNINKLHQEGENMVEKTIEALSKDIHVKKCWLDCFSPIHVENQLVCFHCLNYNKNISST